MAGAAVKKKAGRKKASKKVSGRGAPSQREFSFKEWYKKKGDALNQKRRNRYKRDPDYRQKVLESMRQRRAEAKKKLRAKQKAAPKPQRQLKPRFAVVAGKTISLLSTGQVMERTGLTKLTLVRWLKNEFLPQHVATDAHGRRWFPDYFVDFIADVVLWREEQRLNEDREGRAWFLEEQRKVVLGRWLEARRRRGYPTDGAVNRCTVQTVEQIRGG